MKAASLSLALTAFYVLMAAYAYELARELGPVYAVAIIVLYLAARPWRRPHG